MYLHSTMSSGVGLLSVTQMNLFFYVFWLKPNSEDASNSSVQPCQAEIIFLLHKRGNFITLKN